MSSLDRYAERHESWEGAAGRGVVVCLLVATLLSLALRFFMPGIVDVNGSSWLSNLSGIGVWVISIGLGIWQVMRHRPRQ